MGMGSTIAMIKALAPKADPAAIEQAVQDWLDDHPEATTTVEDGSITEAKLAQDVLTQLGEIDSLKEAIVTERTTIESTSNGIGLLSEKVGFAVGGLTNGVIDNKKYRVSSTGIIDTTEPLTLTIASGFKMNRHIFQSGSYSTQSGFQTGSITVPADRHFKVEIARTSENTSETADVNEFIKQVTFKTGVQKQIDALDNDVDALDGKIDDKTGFVEFITDPNFEDTTNIASGATWQEGYYRGTNGNASTSQYTTNYICSDFIPVNPGEKYRLYVNGTCAVVAEYYSDAKNDGTEASLGTVTGSGSHTDIIVPDGKTYLALNCSLNHSNRVNVIHRLTQHDNEKSICFPRLVYGTQKWIGKKIVNLGDSIFANGVTTGNDISTFLKDELGATVINCAFGGCRMGVHTASQFDAFSMYKLADAIASGTWTDQESALSGQDIPSYFATTLTALKAIDFTEVDVITIAYGTNDFAGGLGIGGSSNYYTDYALGYSIEKILTAYPNLRIFVCLPMYRVWLDESYEFDEDSNTKEVTAWVGSGGTHKLTDFVEAERDVCKGLQIPVLDTYYDLGINKWNWTTYFPATDGTHQNETGRKLIAEYIAPKLW